MSRNRHVWVQVCSTQLSGGAHGQTGNRGLEWSRVIGPRVHMWVLSTSCQLRVGFVRVCLWDPVCERGAEGFREH